MFGQYMPLLAPGASREEKHVETLQNSHKKLQASIDQLELHIKELKRLQSLEEAINYLLKCDDKNASETIIQNKYKELKRLHRSEIELLIKLDNLRIEYYRQRYTPYSYNLIFPEIPTDKQHAILNQLDELGIKYHWEKRPSASYIMVLTESNEATIDSAYIALLQYKKELKNKLAVIKKKIECKNADVQHWSDKTSGLQSELDKDKDKPVTTDYVKLTG